MYNKIEYINYCRVTEVKGQIKYRNFLCIGPIESVSLTPIKDLNGVSIYAHKTERDIHILAFRNAVRIENKKLWSNNLVISIRKIIPRNFTLIHQERQNITRDNIQFPFNNEVNYFPELNAYQDLNYSAELFNVNEDREIVELLKRKQKLREEKIQLEKEIEFLKGN